MTRQESELTYPAIDLLTFKAYNNNKFEVVGMICMLSEEELRRRIKKEINMKKKIPNNVVEFLEWKNEKNFTDLKRVEEMNSKYENICGGSKQVDVLYSFLGIYAIGVWVYNKDKPEMFKIEKNKIKVSPNNDGKFNQILASKNFLLSLQYKNDIPLEVEKLNSVMSPFIKNYFKVGNLIPIWPGGNTLKGNQNNGYMDIPEIFFTEFYDWYKILFKEPNAFLTEFDKYLEENKSTMKNLESFLERICSEESYSSYIKNINLVIEKRTEEIEKNIYM